MERTPLSAGDTTVMVVALTTVRSVPARGPKVTPVAPVKPWPVMVTVVPPVDGPELGEILVMTGEEKVKLSAGRGALVPSGVMTWTAATRADSAGDTTVMVVSLTTVRSVPATVPKTTSVAPVKWVPVMVTVVPPLVGPVLGDSE